MGKSGNMSRKHHGSRGGFRSSGAGPPRKKMKLEIAFDPDARRDYLRGFSERKRKRRAFGLAMQKVKDRERKLEERRETKQAELERIEEAEQQKKTLLLEEDGRLDGESLEEEEEEEIMPQKQNSHTTTTTKLYEDNVTQSQFGGQVVVTTTTLLPSDDDDRSDNDDTTSGKNVQFTSMDEQQKHAGDVQRYLHEFKRNMPAKKNKKANSHARRKGKHGAASMKGIGGAANMKLAQKALSTVHGKKNKSTHGNKEKKAGKRKR